MALVALDWPARFGDVAGQLTQLAERLRDETRAGDLVLLPELCLTGYVSPLGNFDVTRFAEDRDGPTVTRLRALARNHRLCLVAPFVERADGRFHNAIAGIDALGDLTFVYRKRHPWYPETWATPGDEPFPLLSLGGHCVAACVCFDIHFIAAEAAATLSAADVLLFPSAWVEEEDHRESHLTTLASAFDLVVVNANWAPGDVRVPGQGRSMIVTATGAVATSEGSGIARWEWSRQR